MDAMRRRVELVGWRFVPALIEVAFTNQSYRSGPSIQSLALESEYKSSDCFINQLMNKLFGTDRDEFHSIRSRERVGIGNNDYLPIG